MANTHIDSPTDGGGEGSPTGNTGGPSTNAKMRKRTKTGCLTCRKRRIKCGEERPTCGNCIKSKRQCEGYNQRVVFKTPIENWPNHPGHVSTIQYHTSMLPGSRNQPFRPTHPVSPVQESPIPSIPPRPLGNYNYANVESGTVTGHATSQHIIAGGSHTYAQDPSYQQPLPSPHHQQPLVSPHHQAHATNPASYFPQPSPVHPSPPAQYKLDTSASYQASPSYGQIHAPYQQIPVSYESSYVNRVTASHPAPQPSLYQQHIISQPEEQGSYRSHSSVSPRSDQYTPYAESRPLIQRYNSHPQAAAQQYQVSSAEQSQVEPYSYPAAVPHADYSYSNYSSVQIPSHDSDVKYMPQQQRVLGMSRV